MHDGLIVKNVSVMAGSGDEQEGFRGEARSTRSSNKMATVMAARIISEKSLKVKTSK